MPLSRSILPLMWNARAPGSCARRRPMTAALTPAPISTSGPPVSSRSASSAASVSAPASQAAAPPLVSTVSTPSAAAAR